MSATTTKHLRWELISGDSLINFTINPGTGEFEMPEKDGIRKGEVIHCVIGARMTDGSILPGPMKAYVFDGADFKLRGPTS